MKIAIVTGASSGLGAEFARQLDNENLDELWIIARREDRLQTLSQSLNTACRVIVIDLLKSDEINLVLGQLLEEEKPDVKFCVNNAGFGKLGNFEDLDRVDMTTMVDLNCRAVVQVSHLALPFMSSGSSLIHTSSSASFSPLGGFAVYGATKAFVTSFSIALQAELEEREIHSIAVCPGPVETEFSKVAYKGSTRTDRVFDSSKKSTAQQVVAKALKDCKKKKSHSVFGIAFILLAILSKFTPAFIVAKVSHKKIMKTDSGEKIKSKR